VATVTEKPAGANRALRGRQALRPTSAHQAKSFYPAALSAAIFDEVIALAIRGNRLEFHRLGADHAGHERYQRAPVIIHADGRDMDEHVLTTTALRLDKPVTLAVPLGMSLSLTKREGLERRSARPTSTKGVQDAPDRRRVPLVD
jgi:hypothetical protein